MSGNRILHFGGPPILKIYERMGWRLPFSRSISPLLKWIATVLTLSDDINSYELLGFTPAPIDTVVVDQQKMKRTIVSLAGLDAFVAATIFWLQSNGAGKLDGHRQKFYHETFNEYLPVAYNELVWTIWAFCWKLGPEELYFSALSMKINHAPVTTPL